MKKPLKEAWDGMVREGILDALVGNKESNSSQQEQQIDPKIQIQVETLKKQIRDIESKISPLADKKRKLEEEIFKLTKKR